MFEQVIALTLTVLVRLPAIRYLAHSYQSFTENYLFKYQFFIYHSITYLSIYSNPSGVVNLWDSRLGCPFKGAGRMPTPL